MRRLLYCVLVLAAGCSGSGPSSDDPFAYDADAPLDVRETSVSREGDVTVRTLTYASPRGGRVRAVLVEPRGGADAGLILQHGMPGTADDVVELGREFARLGAVAVMIDAPFARRGGEPVRFDVRDRREQIQLIVDLRRAVDLLQARDDVDDDRIAYFGFSYGGAMGGLLAGVEHRIAAFALAVGDGGLVEHFTSVGDSGGGFPPLTAAQKRRWLAAMRPIEPLRWIRQATAPLLFQSGRQDDLVPPADARRYHAAAPEPKDVRWYDSGHFLPPAAVCDAAEWLAQHIGTSTNHAACAAAG